MGWPVAGGGCFVFSFGRVGPGRDLATKVVAGAALGPMGWLIRPLARASKEAGWPCGLRPAAKKKTGKFRLPPRRERWPCWPWRAAAGGAGSGGVEQMQRLFVIHPVEEPARAGSKAKRSGLAASGQGVAQQRKLWRAWPASWRAGSSSLWLGPRRRLVAWRAPFHRQKEAGWFRRPAKKESVGPAGSCALVGSVVECRGGPGPASARWLRLGSAGRASCWPHRRFSTPGKLTFAFSGTGSRPRF